MHWEIPNLYEELTALLAQVPRGRVTTYGALAAALGSRSAARWVGEFMLDHHHRRGCPCHRVVRSTGAPGLYFSGNEQTKVRHLQEESVEIDGGLVNLARFGFDDFDSDKPLERLIELQLQIAKTVSLPPFRETPETVAGVDVSYPARTRAVAAYAEVEAATGRLLWSTTLHRPITFPYIPGLLAFRELPVLLELLARVEAEHRTADLVFVDGNGLLHPRRAGIATCLGVMTGSVTIGVSKKLLLGSVDLNGMTASKSRAVTHNGHLLGMAIKAKESSRPIYVSPGQHINIADAVRMTRLLFHGHRLPEPLYRADAISRRPDRQPAAAR